MRLLWVALGGAIGSSARYLLDGAVYRVLPPTFPYGTFTVNVTGCLLFGLVFGIAEQRMAVGTVTRTFVLIGILGGFTTFSSFTFETLQLLRDGEWLRGAVNVVGQVLGGLLALWAGMTASRVIWP
jgi:CrcB protein